jgi:hypothetical protein
VALGPQCPSQINGFSGVGGGMEGGWFGAVDATCGVTAAFEVGESYVFDGAVAFDSAGYAGRL